MTTQSIVCGTCSAAVPYGRLSCPSCGELLASVAGSRRGRASVNSSIRATRAPDVLYDVDAAPGVQVDEHARGDSRDPADPEADLPWAGALDGEPLEHGSDDGIDRDDDALDSLLGSDDEPDPGVGVSSSTAGHAWAVKGASLTGPSTPVYMPRPNYARAAAEKAARDAAAGSAPVAQAAAPALPAEAPGAYVPPLPASIIPAGPPGPARAWAGHGTGADPDSVAAPGTSTAKDRAVDPSRLAEFIGSVSVAGAALAAVGFLLPWASVMIGTSGVGYFDRWGLAGPAHIVVVVAILAVLALAVVRNPIPTWFRTGIGGLGVGALLLGITWPYLLGPLDAAPGVLIDAIGAVALIGSGILAIVTDRHAEADQPV